MGRIDAEYDRNVFINCPFDEVYAPIFEAIVFATYDLGFVPRSARERLDSSEIRLHKIISLIRRSRLSIHDLSRTELDDATALPRFNMPLELGIDLGCKAFSRPHAGKSFLVFDSEQYRFQKYLSDIGGQDIHRHGNDPKTAVQRVRDWLKAETPESTFQSGAHVFERYLEFQQDLPWLCARLRYDLDNLTFADLGDTISAWLGYHR